MLITKEIFWFFHAIVSLQIKNPIWVGKLYMDDASSAFSAVKRLSLSNNSPTNNIYQEIKMKTAHLFIATALLSLSNASFAEYFCIADQGKPKHCEKGDIVLVKPTLVPRVCDFDAEILRMPKAKNTAEYLCRYTGNILDIKELKNRRPPAKQYNSMPTQPKRNNNKMFNSMPFFK